MIEVPIPAFEEAFDSLLQDLSDHLETDMKQLMKQDVGCLANQLNHVWALHQQGIGLDVGSELQSYQGLDRLLYFSHELRRIKQYDPGLVKGFSHWLLGSDRGNYMGTRMEVHASSLLIHHKIPFEKGESPDFTLSYKGKDLAIECTSAWVNDRQIFSEKDLLKKLQDTIFRKIKKPYMNKNTLVMVDIADIYIRQAANNRTRVFFECMKDCMRNHNIGAVMLSYFIFDFDNARHCGIHFQSSINSGCPEELADFIRSTPDSLGKFQGRGGTANLL
jgi:hypothetical protein